MSWVTVHGQGDRPMDELIAEWKIPHVPVEFSDGRPSRVGHVQTTGCRRRAA